MANELVGDIIDIEHTDDASATDPTWNLVGKTTDTVEIASNVEVADSRIHANFQREQAATSAAWEIGFSAHVVTGTAQLETLGLIDTNSYELQSYVDSRETGNTQDALKITVYDSAADKSSGTVKWDLGTSDYVLVQETANVQVEDYSTRDFTIYSRIKPIRLEAGGSFPTP